MTGAYVSHAAVELQSASQLRKGVMEQRERKRRQTDIKPWTQREKTALREEELRSRGGEMEDFF